MYSKFKKLEYRYVTTWLSIISRCGNRQSRWLSRACRSLGLCFLPIHASCLQDNSEEILLRKPKIERLFLATSGDS